ncbi:MAG TPA: DinB family protein [Acidimicrobiales bacterium]|nr:DinB family protein [Acidimicrobiales bacterium]
MTTDADPEPAPNDAAEPDWVKVVAEERCDECGLESNTVPRAGLGAAIGVAAEAWAELLTDTPPPDLQRRLGGGGWTALEYGCHVRDVFRVFSGRLALILAEDEPELVWWDHGAAVVEDRYAEQDPAVVADELVDRARRFATELDAVTPDGWERTGVRRGTERFTVDGLARFALHETVHHLHDAERAIAP